MRTIRRLIVLWLLVMLASFEGVATAQPTIPTRRLAATECLAVGVATCSPTTSPVTLAGLPTLSPSALLLLDSGNQVGKLGTQSANSVFSGPTSGGAALPTFRALVDGDIPDNLTLGTVGGTPTFSNATAFSSTTDVTGQATFGNNVQSKSPNAYASQTTGFRVTNDGQADFRYAFVDEMHVRQFAADLVTITNGIDQTVKASAMLAATFTCPAAGGTATLTLRDRPDMANTAVFEANDQVIVRNFSMAAGALSISECAGVVTSYTDQANDEQTWTFTRGTSTCAGGMSNGTTIAPDSLVIDYGVTGQGYTEANAVDGAYGQNSPYFQVVTWATCPVAANRTVRARLGRLAGAYGYASGANIYGLAVGDASAAHLTVDPTNGVRGRYNTTTKFQIDPSGNASFSEGNVTINQIGIEVLSNPSTSSLANGYAYRFSTAAASNTYFGLFALEGTSGVGGLGKIRALALENNSTNDENQIWIGAKSAGGHYAANIFLFSGNQIVPTPSRITQEADVYEWGPTSAIGSPHTSLTSDVYTVGTSYGVDITLQPRLRWYRSSAQTLSHNTQADITWNANDSGVTQGSWGSPGASATFPRSGGYVVTCSVTFNNNTTGIRKVVLKANGVEIARNEASAATGSLLPTVQATSPVVKATAGQALACAAYQDSGGNLDVYGAGADNTALMAVKVW